MIKLEKKKNINYKLMARIVTGLTILTICLYNIVCQIAYYSITGYFAENDGGDILGIILLMIAMVIIAMGVTIILFLSGLATWNWIFHGEFNLD